MPTEPSESKIRKPPAETHETQILTPKLEKENAEKLKAKKAEQKVDQELVDTAELGAEARQAAQTSHGEGTPEEIEASYQAAMDAFEPEAAPADSAEAPPKTPEVPAPEIIEPVHEQEPEAEPNIETTAELNPEREPKLDALAEFNKDQLLAAVGQSLDLRDALDREDMRAADKLIQNTKVLFSHRTVEQSGKLIRQKLDIRPDTAETDEESPFEPAMYKGESPEKVQAALRAHRIELLSTDLPLLVANIEQRADTNDPSKKIEEMIVEVRNLVPELQRVVFTGAARIEEFEHKFSPSKDAESLRRFSVAKWAHDSLTPKEWKSVRRAYKAFDDPRFAEQRATLERLPQTISRLQPHRIDTAQREVSKELQPWMEELSRPDRLAIDKYVSTAIELYSGRLSQK